MYTKILIIGLFITNLFLFSILLGTFQEIKNLKTQIVQMDNAKATLYVNPVCVLSMNQEREEYFQYAMACWKSYHINDKD